MAGPRGFPVYAGAIRDGSGSRELPVVDDAGSPQRAARWLALAAAHLRARRVWPSGGDGGSGRHVPGGG